MKQTYTYAKLPVSKAVLYYITRKLAEADYNHCIKRDDTYRYDWHRAGGSQGAALVRRLWCSCQEHEQADKNVLAWMHSKAAQEAGAACGVPLLSSVRIADKRRQQNMSYVRQRHNWNKGMKKRVVKKKQARATWTKAFPRQAIALSPERSAAGGVKARSGSEAVRMQIYNGIRELFLEVNPYCARHLRDCADTIPATEVHHHRGRIGNLLFDVRHWSALCSDCHRWVGSNVAEARAAGWLCADGGWNKLE